MGDEVPEDLARHVAHSTGLPLNIAARVVSDVMGYFVETVQEFVRRRHAELHRAGMSNAEIWQVIGDELALRPVASATLSHRQLRRIVYG